VAIAGLDLAAAVGMASAAPAAFLGLSADHGAIAPGLRANLVVADQALQVTETWIDGQRLVVTA